MLTSLHPAASAALRRAGYAGAHPEPEDARMDKPLRRAPWIKEAITAGNEFHAMKQDPTRHNLINGASTLAVVLSFAGVLASGAVLPWWLYVPLGGALMGCVLFSVFILIIHECSHSMFVLLPDRERSKELNRLVGRVAGAVMFTDYLRHWEKGHTVHHLHPCEPDDPQDRLPLTGRPLFLRYAMLLFVPFSFLVLNPSRQYDGALGRTLVGGLLWAPVMAASWFFSGWAGPVSLLVAFHVLMMLNLTKKAQEHGAGLAEEPERMLRSRTYFYPLAPFCSPFNINYHFEHHANFNVPWYALPAYHLRLMEGVVPEPIKPYYFHHDFLAQLAGTKALVPAELRHLCEDTSPAPAK